MADSSDKSSSTNATTRSGQSLVEDVLRETQALLGETETANLGTASSDLEGATDADPAEAPVDLQSIVDRVDGLLGDLGHLVEEVEAAESAAPVGLDLTLVLPPATPSPEHVVPELGSEGPQVDLFAAPEPEPAEIEESVPPPVEVVLETEASASMPESAESSAGDSMLDDLAAALAEEFDAPALVTASATGESSSTAATSSSSSGSGGSFAVSPVSDTEVALMAAMTEEFGIEPTDLPPVEDAGDPFESQAKTPSEPSDAAKRLESLLAQRLAEEYDLVESASTVGPDIIESEVDATPAALEPPAVIASSADATELVQSDIDAVARAEMEALEALGSELGDEPREHASVEDVDVQRHPEATTTELDTTASTITEASVDSTESEPIAAVVPAEATEDHGSATESETTEATTGDESEADDLASPRPAPSPRGPSAVVRIGALPFRLLPATLHRHVTPVAISLAAWVPIAWGYAILAPKPTPPRMDVLSAGVHEPGEAMHTSEHGPDDARTGHDDHAEHPATAASREAHASIDTHAPVHEPVHESGTPVVEHGASNDASAGDHGSSADAHH